MLKKGTVEDVHALSEKDGEESEQELVKEVLI